MDVTLNWKVEEAGGALSGNGKYSGCVSTDAKAYRGSGSSIVDGFKEMNKFLKSAAIIYELLRKE